MAREAPGLPITLVDGRSREVIAAADVVLTASGTATLEGLLLKRPMVVGYRVHPLTYQLVTQLRLVKVPYVAMANLLVGRALAPEFLQDRCRADLLAPALLAFLDDPERVRQVQAEYLRVHEAHAPQCRPRGGGGRPRPGPGRRMSRAWVAGVDEAGRGPLAGPVTAAAVILDPARPILGLDDSKRLTQARRAALEAEIQDSAMPGPGLGGRGGDRRPEYP